MPFSRHRIFASGVHRNDKDPVWPADRVAGVLAATRALSPARIPYTYRHPENSLPVLGYADRDSIALFEEGGRTYLDIQPVDFAREMMPGLKEAGLDKVSIGLGKKGEIVHIGITDSPAVNGLGVAFEAGEVPACFAEEVTFEAADLQFDVSWKWTLQSWMSDVASLFRKMREREIEKSGIEEADKYLPVYVLDFLGLSLPEDHSEDAVPEAAINPTFETTMTEAEKLELERLRTENAALLQREAERAAESVQAEITGFCDSIPGVVTPAIRPQIIAILTDLHGAAPRTFDTGGKTETKTSYDLLKEMLAGAKPVVVFETVATNDKAPAESGAKPGIDPVQEELQSQFEAVKGR
jgi:hypothetical protein